MGRGTETTQDLRQGDARELIKTLADNSISSVATDPPYEIGFMGSDWDQSGVAFDIGLWKAILKKMSPGAHLIAFSFTTTYDLICQALRDAGFILRDMLLWHYGSGFPKGTHISTAIDKKAGAEREKIDISQMPKRLQRKTWTDFRSGRFHRADGEHDQMQHQYTKPSTQEAKLWHDWHTRLKPSTEPAVLAMKPLENGLTFEQNVLKWGTGALNIGACRIAVNPTYDPVLKKTKRKERESLTWKEGSGFKNPVNEMAGVLPSGRFPSNLILSHHKYCVLIESGGETKIHAKERVANQHMGTHGIYGTAFRYPFEVEYSDPAEIWACVPDCPIRMIDDIAGLRQRSGSIPSETDSTRTGTIFEELPPRTQFEAYRDRGGVSRFFYCAKAGVNERSLGLPEGERNPHKTVKPINLMRYYVRLITPPRGTVLDPFAGSGTTMIAAMLETFNSIGFELDKNHIRIAGLRLDYWRENPEGPSKLAPKRIRKPDPDQVPLDEYF